VVTQTVIAAAEQSLKSVAMCRNIWGHRTEISNYYALCSSLFVDILGFICPGIGNAGVFTLVSS
jgi:hypothetical protein